MYSLESLKITSCAAWKVPLLVLIPRERRLHCYPIAATSSLSPLFAASNCWLSLSECGGESVSAYACEGRGGGGGGGEGGGGVSFSL